MKNLIKLTKYDFMKFKSATIGCAVAFTFFELVFLISAFMGFENLLSFVSILMMIMMISFAIVMFIYAIEIYRKDLSTKSGYMPFLSPVTSYQVIGSKLLTTFIVSAVSLIVIFIYSIINVSIMDSLNTDSWFNIWGDIKEFSFKNVGILSISFINYAVKWLNNILCIYFAMTLSASLLGESKMKGVVTFTLWIGINIILSLISYFVTIFFGEIMNISQAENIFTMQNFSLLSMLIVDSNYTAGFFSILFNLIPAVIMYFASCFIMDKKLSI